ncbi:MAG: hypothetical protein ABFQ89_02560 [Chloroflexota bacterium]
MNQSELKSKVGIENLLSTIGFPVLNKLAVEHLGIFSWLLGQIMWLTMPFVPHSERTRLKETALALESRDHAGQSKRRDHIE